MNNFIIKGCFYFNILYLIIYYLSMLSSTSSFFTLPAIYVSYMGILVFMWNFIEIISHWYIKTDKHLFLFFMIILLFSIVHILLTLNYSSIPNTLAFIIPLSFGVIFEIVLKCEVFDEKKIERLFIFSFVGFALLFLIYKLSSYYQVLGGSIHAVYFIVLLFPIIFTVNRDIYKYISILVVLLISILSFKRGAMLSAALMSLLFVMIRMREARKKEKLLNVLLFILVIFAIQYYYNLGGEDLERTLSRIENIETDGGSGRDEIYASFLNEIQNFSIGDHLFGRGPKATELFNSDALTAHNDWIELYYDYGFICFIIWVFYWVKHIKLCIRSIVERSKYGTMYASVIVAYTVMSMISHVMIYSYFSIVIVYLSYLNYKVYENRDSNLS